MTPSVQSAIAFLDMIERDACPECFAEHLTEVVRYLSLPQNCCTDLDSDCAQIADHVLCHRYMPQMGWCPYLNNPN